MPSGFVPPVKEVLAGQVNDAELNELDCVADEQLTATFPAAPTLFHAMLIGQSREYFKVRSFWHSRR